MSAIFQPLRILQSDEPEKRNVRSAKNVRGGDKRSPLLQGFDSGGQFGRIFGGALLTCFFRPPFSSTSHLFPVPFQCLFHVFFFHAFFSGKIGFPFVLPHPARPCLSKPLIRLLSLLPCSDRKPAPRGLPATGGKL